MNENTTVTEAAVEESMKEICHILTTADEKLAYDFIECLFKDSTEISEEDRKEIIDYFIYMYDRALLESKYSANWQDCIQHWLIDFANSTGQNINLPHEWI